MGEILNIHLQQDGKLNKSNLLLVIEESIHI